MASYKYKLYYFNARGRAEPARWMFAQAGVEYEDVRLAGEKWIAKKPDMPFGQMPALEVTDSSGKSHLIPQSRAIERFLAKQFGLAGKNEFDIARADFLNEYFNDIFQKIVFNKKDPDYEKKCKEFDEFLPQALEKLEPFVRDGGYFLGKELSWADIVFSVLTDILIQVKDSNVLDKTPKLKKLRQSVCDQPKIAEWITNRPKTDF
ncbi:hematopoietic prostaglandin D synthase-like [Styela clava]